MRNDGYFDEHVAARYDESAADMFEAKVVDPAVDFLAGIAGSGRALELGIGTGRIALPLSQRGVPVHGIELSNAMLARLRTKPGAEDIGVTVVNGSFSVWCVKTPLRPAQDPLLRGADRAGSSRRAVLRVGASDAGRSLAYGIG